MVLAVKIILIIIAVIIVLFLLSMIVYFFNLDMKLASKMIPVMNKYYDRQKRKRDKSGKNK